MKTNSVSVVGRTLLGLCLCLSPALLVAQERSSRGMTTPTIERKPEVRRVMPTRIRPEPPPRYQSRWLPADRRPALSAASTSRPQRMFSDRGVTRISSVYGTASATIRQREISPSRVSFLPDGTVITRDATYEPALITEDGANLNQFDFTEPAASTLSIQYPNSALAPPPPPVNAPLPAPAKTDLDKVKTAERVSPGLVKSPYHPHSLLDVQGLRKGSLAQDPASKKLFRVP